MISGSPTSQRREAFVEAQAEVKRKRRLVDSYLYFRLGLGGDAPWPHEVAIAVALAELSRA